MNKKHAFYRGFTLIELMIVIVILGILMGTILPRLTGAQGRARDIARQSDLNTISQALEAYHNDNGKYPTVAGCLGAGSHANSMIDLTDTDNTTGGADKLGAYLKGGKMITPRNTNLSSAGCKGAYYYTHLMKNGINYAAYALVADVETFQMANYTLLGNATIPVLDLSSYTTKKYKDLSNALVQPAADTNPATKTVYVVMP